MKTVYIQSRKNSGLTWVIKKSKSGHYFYNMLLVNGTFYKKSFVRVAGKKVAEELILRFDEFKSIFDEHYDNLSEGEHIVTFDFFMKKANGNFELTLHPIARELR